jgi:CRP-like cAMP-binding protein
VNLKSNSRGEFNKQFTGLWQIGGFCMEQYNPVLKSCALFREIGEGQLEPLMKCMNARVKSYEAGEYVFLSGDKIDYIGVVLEGTVEIIKENLAGSKHIVAILGQADLFAEGIVCTGSRISPVSVRVREATQIVVIPYERVIRSCGNSCSFLFFI